MSPDRRLHAGGVSRAGGRRATSPTTLTVWLYDSAMGAAAGEVRLKAMQRRGAVTVLDALTITWMPGTHTPRVGHLRHRTSAMAAKSSVLGTFVGLLVLAPTADSTTGAGVGALAQRLRGTGIDRQFLSELKDRLGPGSSALLVLSSDTDLDAVRPVIERGRARGDVTLMHASLPDGASAALVSLLDAARRGPADAR